MESRYGSVWVLACLFAVIAIAHAQVAPYYVGYQIHSWDDLDEWHQAIRKSNGLSGEKWFKIDPHFMPPAFCASQSRVPHGDARGCFVLSHDTPSTQSQYNSTQDVALLLQDPDFLPFFTQKERVYIALCFKNSPVVCDNSASAQAWLSLVDEFIARLNSSIIKYNLNVEFVLDGDAAPLLDRPCLWQRWRPLASTWIDLPWEALFYNNTEYGYDRFQVLNVPIAYEIDPAINIQVLARFGYGRFATTKYPFLCWEPSDQSIITSVVDAYLGGKIIRPEGFRFAINIDPVQFLVYSSAFSRTALNYQLPQPKRSFVFSETALGPSYQLFRHPSAFATPTLLSEGSLPALASFGPLVSAATPANAHSSPLVLIADASNQFAFLEASLVGVPLTLIANGSFATATNGSTFAAAIIPFRTATVYLVARAYASDECALGVQVLVADRAHLGQLKPFSPASTACVVAHGDGTTVVSASVAILSSMSGNNVTSICGDTAAAVGVLAFATADKHISHAAFCLAAGGQLGVVGPVIVDVGSSPSVSLGLQNGRPVVLEVHGEGYCYNSETKNKRPFPRVCVAKPSSTPHTLVYNYGTLDAWFGHVAAYKPGSVAWITSCDRSITHGVYDMGSSPSVTLFNSGSLLGLVEVHEGLASSVSSECGAAVAHNGLVMDSWPAFPL